MFCSNINRCRLCKSSSLVNIVSLGEQKITSRFPDYNDLSTPSTDIDLLLCKNCGLVQLKQSTNPDEMYEQQYGYMSSISNTMRKHLKDYHTELTSLAKDLKKGDVVLDIGSNDATTLKYYNNDIIKIGIDPTGEQFKNYYKDTENLHLIKNYFTKDNFLNKFPQYKCKVVTSIAMFYDLPDPVQFAKDIELILDDDGIWTCEQSYLLSMIETNSLDTICHEHLEYYGLRQILYIAEQANLKIIDVKFNSCNGGSFRIYLCKKGCQKYKIETEKVNSILKNEEDKKIYKEQTYQKWMASVDSELNKFKRFVKYANKDGKSIQIYGASTKGNCILQYCNIGEKEIKYAVERNPKKKGKATSTNIPIIMEEEMRKNPPDYLLVLPWHFKKEIIEREKEFLENGGQLIFYLPKFEIISHNPKLLLTGCDGFISSYIKENYNEYSLYGISKSQKNAEKNITKMYFDMNNYEELEAIIQLVDPESIVHLASISSSIEAFKNPIKTLENNGMLTAKLCDIIYRNNKKIKLFNASSSEIYKGHGVFTVDEYSNLDETKHQHPYSIAKVMGQNIVKFYRETYNLHFSNGILFTTQSVRKSKKFLFNKIYDHIKENGKTQPLIIGNIDSFRNIIHPFDVVNGIKYILNSKKGDDYNLCNYTSHKIEDLVFKLYDNFDIKLIRGEQPNIYYDSKSNQPLLVIENTNEGLDTRSVNIKGYPCKLKAINWNIKYSIDDIMNEFK